MSSAKEPPSQDDLRAAFASTLATQRAMVDSHAEERKAAQTAYDIERIALANELRGKGKKRVTTTDQADKWLKNERGEAINAAWRAMADDLIQRQKAETTAVSVELCELAEKIAPRPGSFVIELCREWGSDREYGAFAKARDRAERKADDVRHHKIDATVETFGWSDEVLAKHPNWKSSRCGCRVTVRVADEIDADVLRHKLPKGIVETVRFLLRNGANPRVFYPQLPPGFEKEHGLTA